MWQTFAFTACVLVGLLPNIEVQCRLDVPVAVIDPAPPPPVSVPKRMQPPAEKSPPDVPPADRAA